jgi:hypothetical protein
MGTEKGDRHPASGSLSEGHQGHAGREPVPFFLRCLPRNRITALLARRRIPPLISPPGYIRRRSEARTDHPRYRRRCLPR